MDTDERRGTVAPPAAAPVTDTSRTAASAAGGDPRGPGRSAGARIPRQLWVEEPAIRRRMPDPVRTAAVRAVIILALTLIQAVVAFLCTLAGSWLAFPMVLSGVAGTVVATWSVLDVWVTRQVWNQRHGVVSVPSSTARRMRRERRAARRAARARVRQEARIRRRGEGRLSRA
ncbi:hypothetical protein ACIRD6_37695 [Streptomyces sp. NPDC102473]|uniref:hypothetical protein n=1 Tax=unclassified Streptomyces TaxID=2593676 RepID=UPI00382E7283